MQKCSVVSKNCSVVFVWVCLMFLVDGTPCTLQLQTRPLSKILLFISVILDKEIYTKI